MEKLSNKKVIEVAINKIGSAQKLAEYLGTSYSFIRNIKCGKDPIPYKKIKLLASLTTPKITEQQIFDLRSKS